MNSNNMQEIEKWINNFELLIAERRNTESQNFQILLDAQEKMI